MNTNGPQKPADPPKPPRCQYCGKPATDPKVHKIYINEREVEMTFCSDDCATYRQFGAEG